jgi:hypothetical protein
VVIFAFFVLRRRTRPPLAQGESEYDGHSVNGRPAERACQEWQTLGLQAKQEYAALKPPERPPLRKITG